MVDSPLLLAAPKDGEIEKSPVEVDWSPNTLQEKSFKIGFVINNLVVTKLERAYKLGLPVRTACKQAGISVDTYYRAIKQDLRFARLMEAAQDTALSKSHGVVSRSIKEGDVVTARWYIERRDARFRASNQPSAQTNIQVNVGFDGAKPQQD